MERLIADANEYAEANGQAADLSIDSFSDIVQAIELVQEKQGIAGTTETEAMNTITGSVNMLKSAWDDLLVSFSDPDADIGEKMNNVVTSLEAVMQNLLPVIGKALGAVIENIPKILQTIVAKIPEVLEQIKTALQDAFPEQAERIEKVFNVIEGLFNFITKHGKLVLGVIIGIVAAFETFSLIIKIINAVRMAQAAWNVVQAAFNVIMSMNPIGLVIIAIAALVAIIIVAYKKSETFRNIVQKVFEVFKKVVITAIEVVTFQFKLLIAVFKAVWKGIKKVFSGVGSFFKKTFTKGKENAVKAWDKAKSVFSKVWGKIKSAFSNVGGWFKEKFSNAKDKAVSAWSNAKSKFKGIWDKIKGVFSSNDLLKTGKDLVVGLWNGWNDKLDWIKEKLRKWIGNIKQFLKDLFGIHSPSRWTRDVIGKNLVKGMAVGIDENASIVEDAMQNLIPSVSLSDLGVEDFSGINVLASSPVVGTAAAAMSSSNKSVNVTNYITVDGASNPEQWATQFVNELEMQVRMA